MSGVDFPDGRIARKGAVGAVVQTMKENFGKEAPQDLQAIADSVSRKGALPASDHLTAEPGINGVGLILAIAPHASAHSHALNRTFEGLWDWS